MSTNHADVLSEEWEEANYTNAEEVKVQIQLAILRKLEDIDSCLTEIGAMLSERTAPKG